jgi:hypothetical protein
MTNTGRGPRAFLRSCILMSAVALVWTTTVGTGAPGIRRFKEQDDGHKYFPTTTGVTWVYQDGKLEETQVVSGVDRTSDGVHVKIALVEGGRRQIHLRTIVVRSDGLFISEELGSPVEPQVCILKLPLRVDEAWETTTSDPLNGSITIQSVSGLPEEITVGHGTFMAVPVISKFIPEKAGRDPFLCTSWFAPEIGLIRMKCGEHRDMSLKTFVPGKK